MASASAALSALKQLRSMWQSLLGASVQDLAGAGGGGGGGGGGKKGQDYGNFMKELEKWYNWLQEIESLEEKINYQEKLRSKIQSDLIPHGQDVVKSYMTSLKALQSEVQIQQDLQDAQQAYFDSRREWMNSSQNPFSALYKFDENGQIKYQNNALEQFSQMVGSNEQGKPNMTAKEQYNKLVSMGYGDYLKYDSEGNKIDFGTDESGSMNDENAYESAVQAFWDKIDADKEEMQSLHDSIDEHRDAVLEKQEAMNEIMKSIEDNQISVENQVLKALEDSRQRAIDDAKDERDAIEDAANNLIDGLQDQLDAEKEMYENEESDKALATLQKQLAILQRSGGSASQIANLQSQIADKQKEIYWETQQNEIDALQEASDKQLEKLDAQIELMEEQLAYEQENGLLWSEVYAVMQGSPEMIANYIKENDSEYWKESPAKSTQSYREMLYEAQDYEEFKNIAKEKGIKNDRYNSLRKNNYNYKFQKYGNTSDMVINSAKKELNLEYDMNDKLNELDKLLGSEQTPKIHLYDEILNKKSLTIKNERRERARKIIESQNIISFLLFFNSNIKILESFVISFNFST